MWRPNQQDDLEETEKQMEQLIAKEQPEQPESDNMWLALGSSPLMVSLSNKINRKNFFSNFLKFSGFLQAERLHELTSVCQPARTIRLIQVD